MADEAHTSPAKRFTEGSVAAAVFADKRTNSKSGDAFTSWNISLTRSYQDKKGAWQRTHTLHAGDIDAAVKVLNEAKAFIANEGKDS